MQNDEYVLPRRARRWKNIHFCLTLIAFLRKTHFVFIANDSGFDAMYRLSEVDNTDLFVSQLNQWVDWKLFLGFCVASEARIANAQM